ncbi:hypothetical protein AWW67_13885 [Roseivirga seohaensis]|uniref:Uncharacterized protein n=1 Tax=Roseivirga seohaensis TaxID=1914963 RepID=A0A150XLB2_9BACT|nr:hypothetical protein [Roseivirga seohaensis]KYG79455.1 hypothetical protein AWW67_13885 [Roseivirga seohaensis]
MKVPKIKQSSEAIILGLVSGLIGLYILIQWKWKQDADLLIYLSVSIGLVSTLSRKAANLIANGWIYLGQALGKVTGAILLSIVFFVFLTPISKLQKVFSGKGKFTNHSSSQTNWHDRQHAFIKEDLEELW